MARLPSAFDTLLGLQRALDNYRTSSWLDGAGLSGGGAYPPVNVFRKGDDVALIAELPGVAKSDIEIQVKGRTVRISGGKSVEYPQGSAVHRRERLAGRFDRAVSLPFDIDAERVQAECRDGVLAVLLTRAEHEKPKTIKVS
ncbi:MAG TPA: Hsp20/alpha crystallin family protein [Caulobacteraceae bacterium]|nr:Hsp20/alpha crystallin family protein [Caulobacteraceae bacterium]